MKNTLLKTQHTNQGLPAILMLIVFGLLVSLPVALQAADITWTNSVSDTYTNPLNWDSNTVPTVGDNAINNSGTSVAVQINPGDPNWTPNDNIAGSVVGTSGAFEQNDATNTIGGWFRMGLATNSLGVYSLNAGTLNVQGGRINIGEAGTGILNINGGTINKSGDVLALGDSWLNNVGGAHPSTGTVYQTAGVVNCDSELWVGQGINAVGEWNLSGGSINVNNWFVTARDHSTGTFNMTGGSITKGGGGAWIIGDNGQGIFNHSAGSITAPGSELWIGQAGDGIATNNMSGTASVTVGNWIALGRDNSTGVLNISDTASVTKTGGGNIVIGTGNSPGGLGIINQDGGAITNTTSGTWLGEWGTSTGIWNLNSGQVVLGILDISHADSAIGTFNLNGGSLTATVIRKNSPSGIATLNMNGGTLRAGGDSVNFMHDLDTADLQAGGVIIDSQSYDITIAQPFSEFTTFGGTLTKTGSGTLALTGDYFYSGATMINGGKLTTTTGGYAEGALTVADGAAYGVVVSFAFGQVYPGSLTLGTSGATTLDFDLGSFGNPGSAPISVGGPLAVNSTVTVNIVADLPQVGQFPLISYSSKSGSGSFVLGTLPTGVQAALVDTGSSIDLNITQVDALRWDGQVNGDWDIGTTVNWVNTGTASPSAYTDGNPATFDDNALGTTAVNITTPVNPNGVTVDNSILNYTLSGSGKISGPIGLTKKGTGSLSIGNTGGNDYTGATRIEGGTLSVTSLADGGLPSAIGASTSDPSSLVLAGGTFAYGGPAVTIDRGYSVSGTNNAIQTDSNLGLGGSVAPAADSTFAKLGAATLTYTRQGTNLLGNAGSPAYDIVNGTVVLDGTVSGQTNYNVGEIWVGGRTNSGGSLVLSNSTLNSSSWLAVGRGNGTADFLSSVTLEDSTINLSGGGFSTGYDAGLPLDFGIMILARQNITLNGNSSINVANGSIFFAERRGSTTTVLLNDTSSLFNSGNAAIGIGSGGSLTGSTGTVQIANSAQWRLNSYMSIGNEAGTGILLVKDNGMLSLTSDLNVTDVGASTGTLTVQDDAQVNANNIFVGKDDNASGVLTITGNGSVVSSNGLTMATHWQGHSVLPTMAEVNLEGGSLAVNLVQGSTNVPSLGTFNFDGGRLIARNPIGDNFMFNLAAINVLSGGATIDSDTHSISIAQPLLDGGGSGGLTKVGSGTLNLNGVNTYTGATLVDAGAFGGTGVISGPVSVAVAGTLAPGTSVGTLNINNSLTLAGNVMIELDKALAQPGDYVNVTGALSYGGTLSVSNIGTNALELGDTFTVFPTGGSGSFASVEGDAGAGLAFEFNDGVVTVVTGSPVAPELMWANLGGGVIEFSWSGPFKLAYQTNSLAVGLSTNWMVYPDASNPINVTNDPAIPGTFFGLQPE